MNDTMKWFAKADLKKFESKYIAIVGEEVISSGDDPEAVYSEAKDRYPDEEVILWKVPRKDFLISEFMYVDSGADFTLIPYRLGKFLGFRHEDEEIHEIHGINGTAPVVFKTISTKLGNHEFQMRAAWSQLEDVPLLLGRLDVFDQFDITFRQNNKKVIFEVRNAEKYDK